MGIEVREKKVIACDFCDSEIPTGPHVADSGWMKIGYTPMPLADRVTLYCCPKCWDKKVQEAR